jgi:hypothetical protein
MTATVKRQGGMTVFVRAALMEAAATLPRHQQSALAHFCDDVMESGENVTVAMIEAACWLVVQIPELLPSAPPAPPPAASPVGSRRFRVAHSEGGFALYDGRRGILVTGPMTLEDAHKDARRLNTCYAPGPCYCPNCDSRHAVNTIRSQAPRKKGHVHGSNGR